GIQNIDRVEWDLLLDPDDSPFLEYDWIYAMEESGCATPEKGRWQPMHLTVRENKKSGVIAAVPLYVKYHSMGEFIFDQQGWAEASMASGLPYYPKLLVGIPFTPAAGARVLVSNEIGKEYERNVRQSVARFLRQLAVDNQLSSVHVNFCTDKEVTAFCQSGFLHRKSLQYHWQNIDRREMGGEGDDSGSPGAEERPPLPEGTSDEPCEGGRGGETGWVRGAAETVGSRPKYEDFDAYLGNFASRRRIKV
ncbi:unnamed protein product, partial [Choristocarpus tenellus]